MLLRWRADHEGEAMSSLRVTAAPCIAAVFAFGSMVAMNAARAQDFPNKPIRIVTGGVGGSSDFAARLLGAGLTDVWGQPVIVDNRPSSVVPMEVVSKAPPDGYTLLAFGTPLWIGPLLQKAPYDPIRDFAPVTLAVSTPNILAVTPALPVATVRELIVLAKAKPGSLNYASGSTGGSNHLAAELFKSMAAIDVVRVTYKSNATQIADLLGGQVQMTFATIGTVSPHLKSGKLTGLGVCSALPSALLPGMPTVAASGLPGYESASMNGIFAPAGTATALVNRLNQQLVHVLRQPAVREKFFNIGVETVGSSPVQFAATINSEMVKLGKVIKDAGIRAE